MGRYSHKPRPSARRAQVWTAWAMVALIHATLAVLLWSAHEADKQRGLTEAESLGIISNEGIEP